MEYICIHRATLHFVLSMKQQPGNNAIEDAMQQWSKSISPKLAKTVPSNCFWCRGTKPIPNNFSSMVAIYLRSAPHPHPTLTPRLCVHPHPPIRGLFPFCSSHHASSTIDSVTWLAPCRLWLAMATPGQTAAMANCG